MEPLWLLQVVCVRRQLLLFNGNLDGKRPAHYGVRYFCSKVRGRGSLNSSLAGRTVPQARAALVSLR